MYVQRVFIESTDGDQPDAGKRAVSGYPPASGAASAGGGVDDGSSYIADSLGTGSAEDAAFLKELFILLTGLPPEARSAVLDAACEGREGLRKSLNSLLVRDSMDSRLDRPLGEETGGEGLGELDADEDSLGPVPDRIGPYIVTGVLGMGASGVVYLAQQREPSREVAVKVLRIDSPLPRRRFERESEFMAALRHPGIAQVYERGIDLASRLPYIVMELVPGALSVRAYAEGQSLNVRDRVKLVLQACEAVVHAHAAGVLHRDLKPANLLVDRTGLLKVVDFGVGRWLGVAGTGVHTMVGSLDYISPEQLVGRAAAPSDVYSLGAVLYELVCGRPPVILAGVTVVEAIGRIERAEPVRPLRINKLCGGDLNSVILKAIAKNTADRYITVAQFADDLRRVLGGEQVTARPDTMFAAVRRAVRRRPAMAAAVVSVVVASGAWGLLTFRQHERQLLAASRMTTAAVQALDFMETRRGSTPIRRKLVDTYLPVTEELVQARPSDRDARYLLARLWDVKGDLYFEANNLRPVRGLREKSLEILNSLADEVPASIHYAHRKSLAMIRLGDVEASEGRQESQSARYRAALEIQEGLVRAGANDPVLLDDLGWSYGRMANDEWTVGNFEAALAFINKQIMMAKQLEVRPGHLSAALWSLQTAHTHAGWLLAMTERRAEAEAHVRAAAEAAERLVKVAPDELRYLSHAVRRALTLIERVEIPAGNEEVVRALVATARARVEQLKRFDAESYETLEVESMLLKVRVGVERAAGHLAEADAILGELAALEVRKRDGTAAASEVK